VNRSWRKKICHGGTKTLQKIGGWRLFRGQKLAGNSEGGTIQVFSCRLAIYIPGHHTETQQHPWEVPKPLIGGQPRSEAVLEGTVETLHQTISLRMVGGGHLLLDPQE